MAVRRITAWVLPDQLIEAHPAVNAAAAEVGVDRVRVVLVESRAWLQRLPYHRKRQALILSAGRHHAENLRAEGFEVEVLAVGDTLDGLRDHVARHKPARILTMESTEHAIARRQRSDLGEKLGVPVDVLPNSMFLVAQHDPTPDPVPGRRYVMENFYRSMRKHFDLLMEPGGTPTGGVWNLDKENRRPLPRGQVFPPRPSFPPDDVTRGAMAEVEDWGVGVGSTSGFDLAVNRAQAASAFDAFLADRLPDFGPFEDAMSRDEGVLFHSVLSPYMNLGLLEPLAMARAAEAEYRAGRAPLNSVEGFVRQIVGWREYMYWQYRRQMPGLREANSWGATRPMPAMFWGEPTDMACVRAVVGRLLAEGYTHHIERLMVVCNLCVLAGVDPAAVADWFLTFYIDSHEWVVYPNVIGMGLNADGGVTATKPYISSAAYINKMGDFCKSCVYSHTDKVGPDACPFNVLYWNFLIENEAQLRANPRLGPAVLGLRHLGAEVRVEVRASAAGVLAKLAESAAVYAPGGAP